MSEAEAPFVPSALNDLVPLALDLRWMRTPSAQRLWERIDADLWRATRNPWSLLQTVGRQRLDFLARDADFRAALETCSTERHAALAAPAWYAQTFGSDGAHAIAYFSMEFGLGESLPIYAGGLGILAGDHLKSASDLGVPIFGVGLLWRSGYFRQSFDAHDWQTEFYPPNDPSQLPVEPVRDADDSWLVIRLRLPGRIVRLRAWRARVGRVDLFLLDSNDLSNAPSDRAITAELYGGAARTRLEQELVLGVGGFRLLRALGVRPDVCHLNEGHAAFAGIERARTLAIEAGVPFAVALAATRAGNAFTTHTPVAAGFDRFESALIQPYLDVYAEELSIDAETLAALGREGGAAVFNMAHLALRTSTRVNGVSRLHGTVSRQLFADLFANRPYDEVPVHSVTNGVHTPTWTSDEAAAFWRQAGAAGTVSLDGLWAMRSEARARLVENVRERLERQVRARGDDAERVASAERAFDPHALTLGFARRFTAYKRPGLLLSDPNRLAALLLNAERPVQIVVSGKAHPKDDAGKAIIREWLEFSERPDVRERVAFLADYDLELAEELVSGVDVWINTPRRPWEASGTSGMKVLANGGLNCSISDGWWAEVDLPDAGWTIPTTPGTEQDVMEARSLYAILEDEIVRLFYDRDSSGLPQQWLERVRTSATQLTARFSSDRMVRDYASEVYVPAARAYRARASDGAALAADLVAWQANLDQHWDGVRLGELRLPHDGGSTVEVDVTLGGLPADAVGVELYAEGRASGQPPTILPTHAVGTEREGGWRTYSADVPPDRSPSDFTARIVPANAAASIPLESGHIIWSR